MLQNDYTPWNGYACNSSADEVHSPTVHHDNICRLSLSQLPHNNPGTGTETGLQYSRLQLVIKAGE